MRAGRNRLGDVEPCAPTFTPGSHDTAERQARFDRCIRSATANRIELFERVPHYAPSKSRADGDILITGAGRGSGLELARQYRRRLARHRSLRGGAGCNQYGPGKASPRSSRTCPSTCFSAMRASAASAAWRSAALITRIGKTCCASTSSARRQSSRRSSTMSPQARRRLS